MKRLLLCTLTVLLMLFALASCFGTEAHRYVSDCATICADCNLKTREPLSEHTYDGCIDTDCNVCGEVRKNTVPHTFSSPCDTECNLCKATREAPSAHAYRNGCDTDCDFCGAQRVTEHKYENDCDRSCNECGAIRIPSAHVYTHPCSLVCDECGANNPAPAPCRYSNACDAVCNECGATRAVGDHVYDDACDAACNECGATRAVGDHVYDDACDATCNECGATRENVHTFSDWKRKTPATCMSDEILERYCTSCKEEETKTGAPSLGHLYTNTCDTTCDRADCDYVRVITHTFGDFVTKNPATCETSEIKHRLCSVCGAEETRIGEAALGHKPLKTDCEVCSVCGKASGFTHSFGDFVIKTPEDCYVDAIEHRLCKNCDKEETRAGAPAHGHDYTDNCKSTCKYGCGFERVPPHVYDGSEDLECNECGYNRECTGHLPFANDCAVCRICGEASGISHHFGEWATKSQESCTDAEIENRVCSVCEKEETRTGTAALGHTPSKTDCALCSVCGKASDVSHNFSNFVIKTPATCETDAVEARTCSKCQKEETKTVEKSALGHAYDNTCDTDCNTCGTVRTIEHSFEGVSFTEKTPADCYQAQILARKCLVCKAEETKKGIDALGHAYTNACDTDCNRCGFSRETEHKFGEWVTKTEADCENAEILHKLCGVCGAESTETMEGKAALGHKALASNCLVCEYCEKAMPDAEHKYTYPCDTACSVCGCAREADHSASKENCTVCLYCEKAIPGAEHVGHATDCTVCAICNASTGKSHTPNTAEDCTRCAHCGKSLGTAHPDADSDGNCDICPKKTRPGDNWFPWAPL